MSTSLAKRRARFGVVAAGFDAAGFVDCACACVRGAVWAAGGRTVFCERCAGFCALMLAAPNGTSCWMAEPRTRSAFESGDAGVRFSYAPHPMAARTAMHAAAANE